MLIGMRLVEIPAELLDVYKRQIIQVADLVLPDKDTTFEEYTTIELLSVAMLIVISTFALDFIHSDRSIFKIVDLDEALSLIHIYEILQELSKYPIIASTESTVYPLLRRLQKENYLQSTWQESAEGLPPRKYYSLTPEGKEYLEAMNNEWENLLNAMSDLKGE